MIQVKFHTYCGLAGDFHMLLVGTTEDGMRCSTLFNRACFRLFNLRRAKKRVMKEIEILTGQKPTEA